MAGVAIKYTVNLETIKSNLESQVGALCSIGLTYKDDGSEYHFSRIVFDPVFITGDLSAAEIIYYLYI